MKIPKALNNGKMQITRKIVKVHNGDMLRLIPGMGLAGGDKVALIQKPDGSGEWRLIKDDE